MKHVRPAFRSLTLLLLLLGVVAPAAAPFAGVVTVNVEAGDQVLDLAAPLRCNDAEFGEMRPYGVDQHGALTGHHDGD